MTNGTSIGITNMTLAASDCRSQESWLPSVTILFITLILGIIGNILVLLTVIGRRKKRTGNDLFIANVAVSSLALLLFVLPLKLHAFLICDQKALFPAFCSVIWPLAQLTFFVSIFTMTAMAIHRCRHVVKPFLPPDKTRHIYLCIALIWLMSTAVVLPLFIVTKMDPITEECREEFKNLVARKAYTAALFVFQLIIPLFIISGAYFLIWRDLSRSTAARASVNRRGQVTTNSSSRENKQVIRTNATIVIMFVICMLPNHISWMLWDFGGQEARKAATLTFKIAVILVMFNSCVNPIVYGSLTRHFRCGYYRYLCFICHVFANYKGNKFSRSSPVVLPSHNRYTNNLSAEVVLQPCNTDIQSVKVSPSVNRGTVSRIQ